MASQRPSRSRPLCTGWVIAATVLACRTPPPAAPSSQSSLADAASAAQAPVPDTSAQTGVAPSSLAPIALPRAASAVALDAHASGGWQAAAETGGFLAADGRIAQPFTLALLQADDRALYLALYAADEDLAVGPPPHATATDQFTVTLFRPATAAAVGRWRVQANGAAEGVRLPSGAPWTVAAGLSVDLDGSLDDGSSGDDEEWAVFAALPWSQLGGTPRSGETIGLEIVRRDAGRPGTARMDRTTRWRGEIVAP